MKAYIVDTNVLIDIKNIINGNINPQAKRYYRNYSDLIETITDRDVQIIVMPTVLEEIKQGAHKDDYSLEILIERFCLTYEFSKEELDLVDKLYNDYIDGDEPAVPIFKEINGGVKYNSKDARILAEATVVYNNNKKDIIKLITNNISDFTNPTKIGSINSKYCLKSIPFNSVMATNAKKEIR